MNICSFRSFRPLSEYYQRNLCLYLHEYFHNQQHDTNNCSVYIYVYLICDSTPSHDLQHEIPLYNIIVSRSNRCLKKYADFETNIHIMCLAKSYSLGDMQYSFYTTAFSISLFES